jgi:multisubunit Na+/H+ antiporter MnhG subunit
VIHDEHAPRHPTKYDYLAVLLLGIAVIIFCWSWSNHEPMVSLAALVFMLGAIAAAIVGRRTTVDGVAGGTAASPHNHEEARRPSARRRPG